MQRSVLPYLEDVLATDLHLEFAVSGPDTARLGTGTYPSSICWFRFSVCFALWLLLIGVVLRPAGICGWGVGRLGVEVFNEDLVTLVLQVRGLDEA